MRSFTAQLVEGVSMWTYSMMNDSNINRDDSKEHKKKNRKTDSKIVSDVMEHAMGQNMLTRLMHSKHRNAAKLWGKLCHRIDISYPPKHELKPIDKSNKSYSELMDEIRYSMRHSFCAYQPAIVAMKSEEVTLAFKTQKCLLKSCFNLSDDDIIIDNCTLKLDDFMVKTTHEPSFYLIIHHKKKKIVLSIRGTSSIGDILTDLNATNKKCHLFGIDGSVHEGMLESAYFIRRKVSLQLINICQVYTDYGVIICGHSLGAGVAALLGLMYKDHPIIYKRNGLRVYAFASPCIVSKEFTDCNMGNEYITSIALSTDVVTRLSFESVRKCNMRQDLIMEQSKDMINKCLKYGILEDECAAAEFLRVLRSLQSPASSMELYPLGKVLWFVPNIVMNNDIMYRRKRLMNVKDNDDMKQEMVNDNNGIKGKLNDALVSTWNNMTKGVTVLKESMMDLDTFDVRMNSSTKHVFREFYHDLSKGVKDIKSDIQFKLDKSKRKWKYNGDNYILCDASSCRYIFQDLVFDLPESINAHEPQRYLWACDAALTQ